MRGEWLWSATREEIIRSVDDDAGPSQFREIGARQHRMGRGRRCEHQGREHYTA